MEWNHISNKEGEMVSFKAKLQMFIQKDALYPSFVSVKGLLFLLDDAQFLI